MEKQRIEIERYQSKIKDLEQSKLEQSSYLDLSMSQMQGETDQLKQQVEALQSDLIKAQKDNDFLEAQLKQKEIIISEKNQVTEGQDKENAETHSLLIEAQQLIDQKIAEVESLNTELKNLRSQISKKQDQILTLQESNQSLETTVSQLEFEKDNL